MYHPMAPCPSCQRHVRASETACPFCKTSFGDGGLVARSFPTSTGPLSRAAAVALGLSMAAMAGCDPPRQPALYGGPPPPPPDGSTRVIPPPPAPDGPTTPTTPTPPTPPPATTSGRTAPPPVPVAMYGAPMPRSQDGGAPFPPSPQPQAPAYGMPPPQK